ncbi:MAG: hypothetical protein Q7R95_05160 [bacterium]|nr:hypothetical protein [bacterium]
MFFQKYISKKIGESLIEIILAMSLMVIVLPALMVGLISSVDGKAQLYQRVQATSLIKESEEAIRSIKENGWSTFAVNGTYHATISGSLWTLQPGSETLSSGITRQLVISNVYRNTNDQIVISPTPGILDPSTKKVDTTVSWTTPLISSITSTAYLTRHENISYLQSTQANFDAGVKTNTITTNNQGGEVQLGAGGGGGDWCNPSLSVTTADLSRQGIPTSVSAIQGSVVTATGGNASGPTFAQITVAENNPPSSNITGTYDNTKGNDVFRDIDKYAYITTTDHSQEVKILDLTQFSDAPTNSKFLPVGYFDAPGNSNGNSVNVLNNIGYMTSDDKFYTFDLSSKLNSRSRLGSYTLNLAGTGNKMTVVKSGTKTYAFVAVNSTTTQMQVIDVTDPSNPSIIKQVQTQNNQSGVDVTSNSTGTRVYLVTNYSSGKKDFFIIDTSDLSGGLTNLPIIGSGYDTNGMNPKAVAITTGNRVIIVGTGGTKQYVVLDISNESSPVTCGNGLSIANGAFDVATVLQDDGYAYSYVVTGDTNAELKIILGGSGGQYSANGIFESNPYNNFSSTAFNSFTATVNQPSQTTIKIKVAVADAVSGNCTSASYSYVGPTGNPSDINSYFVVESDPTNIKGIIPYLISGNYKNPGQCFRYKVWFQSSDSTATPVLYDFTVNYSP